MKKFLKLDLLILIPTLLLLAIGIFTLYSLTFTQIERREVYFEQEFTNQLIFLGIGTIFMLVGFLASSEYLKMRPVLAIILILTYFLLLFTIFFGIDIKGVRRWINIGGAVDENGILTGGFTLQASEFSKLTLIVISSYLLSIVIKKPNNKYYFFTKLKDFLWTYRYIFLCLVFFASIIALIMAQRSLSVVFVLITIFVSIIIAASNDKLGIFIYLFCFVSSMIIGDQYFIQLNIYFKVLLAIVCIFIFGYAVFTEKISQFAVLICIIAGVTTGGFVLNYSWENVLKNYQRERILTYINPEQYEDQRFQQDQSIISIGGGQFFGQGFRQISDSRLLLLPEPTTDFIFAIFSFKFGFFGSLILFTLYIILISRLFYLSNKVDNKYFSLILIGLGSMFLIQIFFNLGMNMGFLPVGGTTLPFISAGGSSLITSMIAIGIALNISASVKK